MECGIVCSFVIVKKWDYVFMCNMLNVTDTVFERSKTNLCFMSVLNI